MSKKNNIDSLNILREVISNLDTNTIKIEDVLLLIDSIDNKFENVEKMPDKQVYCGDIVTLSIDGDFDHEYFIAYNSRHKKIGRTHLPIFLLLCSIIN